MKKLLQATSAMALMLISSQAFASNSIFGYNEEEENQIRNERAAQGESVAETNRYIDSANAIFTILFLEAIQENQASISQVSAPVSQASDSNFDQDSIEQVALALSQSGMSNEEIDNVLADQMFLNQAAETTPISRSVPQASVVSIVAPAPAIDEAVQKTSVSMLSLKDRNSPYYQNFQVIYWEMHQAMNVSGSKSKNYALQHWINKKLEDRLYYPAVWNQFRKIGFDYDPRDVNMAPAHVQVNDLHALYYNAMNERHHVQIEDLKAIGSQDTRSKDAIVQSMSAPTELNDNQKLAGDFMNVWNNIKRK